MLSPDRKAFAADPFGYGALAWQKWGTAQTVAGFPVEIDRKPTREDLKSPVLWLAQAHALSEAASAVLRTEPSWEAMPVLMRGVCDCQFCATGLMLVGYSLEICLKAMLILTKGIDAYISEERNFKHHKLERLAEHVPNLSEKDRIILRLLTHFVEWAGRYPDPGSSREGDAEEILSLSEHHQIAGRDLFGLSARVMQHTQAVIAKHP